MEPSAAKMSQEQSTLPLVLRFISGKYQGGEFPLPTEGEIVIGRSSELEMVLVEDMVSRRHARIVVENGTIFLEDLGSTNGSFVNGERITKAQLSEGDRVLIGTSIIKLVPTESAGTVEEAKQQMADAADAAVAQPAGSQSSTMSGSIAEVPVPDLLQLFSASKKDGVLRVTTEHDEGKVYLDKGKIHYAVVNGDESVPAEKAFYRILVWDQGRFDLLQPEEREFVDPLNVANEALLMDGMRQLDEMRRLGDALPSLKASIMVASPLEAPLREASPEQLDVIQLALNYETLGDMMNHSGQSDVAVAEAVVKLLQAGYLVAQ